MDSGFINQLNIESKLICWLIAVRRRIRTILLFPVLISFSLVSWVLYSIEGRSGNKTAPKRKTNDIDLKKESTASSDDFEMDLIEEIAEEHLFK